jgi:DNA-binding NtrC family response regulator
MARNRNALVKPKGKSKRDLVPEDLHFPEVRDIAAQLHFSPEHGRIWLEDRRMLLLHAESFYGMRSELVARLGLEAARGVITRMGYGAGSRDAEFAKRLRGAASAFEAFAVGPQLHALKGMAEIRLQQFRMDVSSGQIYSEFVFHDSFEIDQPVGTTLLAHQGACWMLAGYASGYASAFMAKNILVREVECRACGGLQCRAVARPAEDWPDADRDLQDLQPFVGKTRAAPVRRESPRRLARLSRSASHADSNAPVGGSMAFSTILHQINRVAPTRATVLLLGESGVGKSLFARELHDRSPRKARAFVAVNCAAIPNELLESELFGADRGAYTGAHAPRGGRFELADGGTLFLDEIATLSLTAQGKLLRVLQTGEFERLGSTRTRNADVRVIAATNADLAKSIRDGTFRQDLFYRLNVFPILIPPLRERRDDIPLLIGHYLARYSTLHARRLPGLTPRALAALLDHDWPGNVRELENVLERGVILADEGQPLDRSHLFAAGGGVNRDVLELGRAGELVAPHRETHADTAAADALKEVGAWLNGKESALDLPATQDRLALAALARANGNMSKAARQLRLTRAQLEYRIKKIRAREPGG